MSLFEFNEQFSIHIFACFSGKCDSSSSKSYGKKDYDDDYSYVEEKIVPCFGSIPKSFVHLDPTTMITDIPRNPATRSINEDFVLLIISIKTCFFSLSLSPIEMVASRAMDQRKTIIHTNRIMTTTVKNVNMLMDQR